MLASAILSFVAKSGYCDVKTVANVANVESSLLQPLSSLKPPPFSSQHLRNRLHISQSIADTIVSDATSVALHLRVGAMMDGCSGSATATLLAEVLGDSFKKTSPSPSPSPQSQENNRTVVGSTTSTPAPTTPAPTTTPADNLVLLVIGYTILLVNKKLLVEAYEALSVAYRVSSPSSSSSVSSPFLFLLLLGTGLPLSSAAAAFPTTVFPIACGSHLKSPRILSSHFELHMWYGKLLAAVRVILRCILVATTGDTTTTSSNNTRTTTTVSSVDYVDARQSFIVYRGKGDDDEEKVNNDGWETVTAMSRKSKGRGSGSGFGREGNGEGGTRRGGGSASTTMKMNNNNNGKPVVIVPNQTKTTVTKNLDTSYSPTLASKTGIPVVRIPLLMHASISTSTTSSSASTSIETTESTMGIGDMCPVALCGWLLGFPIVYDSQWTTVDEAEKEEEGVRRNSSSSTTTSEVIRGPIGFNCLGLVDLELQCATVNYHSPTPGNAAHHQTKKNTSSASLSSPVLPVLPSTVRFSYPKFLAKSDPRIRVVLKAWEKNILQRADVAATAMGDSQKLVSVSFSTTLENQPVIAL